MATPRNYFEIILLDRGFSRLRGGRFKKIYLPMLTDEDVPEQHSVSCRIDVEERTGQCSIPFGSRYGSVDEVDGRDRGRVGYLECLRSFLQNYKKVRSDDSSFDEYDDERRHEREPLYLSVSSLPEYIRDTVFDNGKINVENWEALDEAIMWLAGVKTSDSCFGYSCCPPRQTVEYMNIIRTIVESCMSREELLNALHLK